MGISRQTKRSWSSQSQVSPPAVESFGRPRGDRKGLPADRPDERIRRRHSRLRHNCPSNPSAGAEREGRARLHAHNVVYFIAQSWLLRDCSRALLLLTGLMVQMTVRDTNASTPNPGGEVVSPTRGPVDGMQSKVHRHLRQGIVL